MILERPITFLDFETTGTNILEDRIIEYAFLKVYPDGEKEEKSGFLNPGIPIPAGATKIHGIKDSDVEDKPMFKNFAKGILAFLDGSDIGGFSSNQFDIPLLYVEFNRVGIVWDYSQHHMIDVGNIFKIKEERTLSAAVRFYCGKELDGAHGALADIIGTVEVFQAQMQRYNDLPQTIQELDQFSNYDKKRLDMSGKFVMAEDGQTILLNFGKAKGLPALNDKGFLNWMLGKRDQFLPDAIAIAEKLFYGEKGVPKY